MNLVKSVLGVTGGLLLVMACSSSGNDTSNPGDDGGASSSGSSGSDGGGTPDTGFLPDGAPIPVTAHDGIKDGDETDVDCGGSSGTACAPGEGCLIPGDCTSLVCTGDKCQAPTSSDGVKNGNETDVDCGGTAPDAKQCAVGKSCLVQTDCASAACNYANKCIAIKSCTQHHGGDTCGTTANAADQESCCTTIPGSVLDKYNVTAGRFRVFSEAVNGDLRTYITNNAPSWWNSDWTQWLPTQFDNGGTNPDYTGLYQELGAYAHETNPTPPGNPSNEGCTIKNNGARTFRLPDAINTRMGDPQYYTQDVLDEKPINCVNAYIAAAFCAWDGARFPTRAEWDAAWGPDLFPWGAGPNPAGYQVAFDSDATGSPLAPPNSGMTDPLVGEDVKRANFVYNWWVPATKVQSDYSLYISEPGRFPTGNGPQGHADLAGNLFNYQGIYKVTPSATVVTETGYYMYGSKSGSWQGHPIPYPNADAASDGYSVAAEYHYWALGIRCARD